MSTPRQFVEAFGSWCSSWWGWSRRLLSASRFGLSDARNPVLMLLLAALVPILTFGGWMAYSAARAQREAARDAARDVVERVSERIDAELSAQLQVAQTLALSASLDEPDLATFYREAERLRQARPLWHTVELDDLNGNQLVNLLRPLGEALGSTADRASFEIAVRQDRPVVGGIGPVGFVSGARLVALRVPVRRTGALRQVLTVAFAPEAIGSILRGAGVPEGWIGVVVDGDGRVIARSRAEDMTLGQPAGAGTRQATAGSEAGFYRGQSLEGIRVEVVFRTVPKADGWSIHLGIPSEALDGSSRRGLIAIGGGLVASLALAGGLVAMVSHDLARQRHKQERRAAVAIEDSEARAALAIDAAEFGTWTWDLEINRVLLCSRCQGWLGLPAHGRDQTLTQAAFLDAVHLNDRASVRDAIDRCRDGASAVEVEFRGEGPPPPGKARWLRVRGRVAPLDGTADHPGRVIHGIMADIDPQKRAEAERQDLLRRLSEAQERTQARIARELHDQVGQTVTGLSLGLKRLEGLANPGLGIPAEAGPAFAEQVDWLRRLAGEIGRDLHRVAADLRPTALDDLGLARALTAHAAEWSRRHGIAVDVQATGLDATRLPPQIETAAYRVVQEAMTNVIKHARASQVSVVLDRRARELRVLVEDDGVGFDAEVRPSTDEDGVPHLGLSGMRERLALVDGNLAIESAPGSGTTLFAQIPLYLRTVTP